MEMNNDNRYVKSMKIKRIKNTKYLVSSTSDETEILEKLSTLIYVNFVRKTQFNSHAYFY